VTLKLPKWNVLYAYRLYLIDCGRWTQRDPIGYQDSENLYQFCGNNPVNAIDILGLKAHTYTCTYDHSGGIEVAKNKVENPDNNPLYKGKESDINSETGLPIARTFSSKKELIEKIKKDAENDGEAVSVTIIAHGRQDSIRTGRKERIKTEEEFKNLGASLNGNVIFIDFLVCELMGTPSGRKKGVILATHANSPVKGRYYKINPVTNKGYHENITVYQKKAQ